MMNEQIEHTTPQMDESAKTIQKLVIANRGGAGTGKTTSLRMVYEILCRYYVPNIIIPINDRGDVCATFTINGVLVGIETYGDSPKPRVPKSMASFVAKGCSIIVTACRYEYARDTTRCSRRAVENLATLGYHILWAKNPRTDNEYPTLTQYTKETYALSVASLIINWAHGRVTL